MDDRVIEAAAMAMKAWNYDPEGPRYVPTYWDDLATISLTAALRALEPELRAAVERLEQAATDWKDVDEAGNGMELAAASNAVRDARRDLFALLGIEDQP